MCKVQCVHCNLSYVNFHFYIVYLLFVKCIPYLIEKKYSKIWNEYSKVWNEITVSKLFRGDHQ